jgi:tRNA pseudouridine55 synthase
LLEDQQHENHSQFDEKFGHVINVLKPEGWTSFDVVRWIKSRLGKVKVGHAGTLDPFARGVLLVCIGSATKRASELMSLEKEYEGCIELGTCTDTFDVTGKVLQRKTIPHLDIAALQQASDDFVGETKQTPPMYSAVKVDGQRLYKIARTRGYAPRKERIVKIISIKVLDFEQSFVFFRVRCLKGTYIRTLAVDWAERMGTVGYLKTLTRNQVGSYHISEAHNIHESLEQLLKNY